MVFHLAGISQAVEPGAHAALLPEQAGRHLLDKLTDRPWATLSIGPPARAQRS